MKSVRDGMSHSSRERDEAKNLPVVVDTILNTDKNVFLTGKAGTGKSTLLKHIRSVCRKNMAVLAPTGVAALNVEGQTIHKFFGFYIDVTVSSIQRGRFKPKSPAKQRLMKSLELLVIDEISMVRADMIDCIDEYLSKYGPKPGEPFGGVQLLFIGDLYQLPPIVKHSEQKIFEKLYKTPYFFSALAMKTAPMETIELTKVYRQSDQEFIDVLNNIRSGQHSDKDIKILNTRLNSKFTFGKDNPHMILTTTNAVAEKVNAHCLNELKTPIISSQARITGEVTKDYYPTDEALKFKVEAQIMLINNDSEGHWVNGSIGIIENASENVIEVKLDSGKTVFVGKHEWKVYKFELNKYNKIEAKEIGSFKQFPFKLGWAITIHKSQGKTFEKVLLDIGSGAFATGQLYVGLSRCTSLQGLVLRKPIESEHVIVDKDIVKFVEDK